MNNNTNNTNNNNNKLLIIVFCVTSVIVIGLLAFLLLNKNEKKQKLRLEDDFYSFINAKELEKKISLNEGEVSYFKDVQDRLDEISDEIALDMLQNGDNQNLKNVYNNYINDYGKDELGFEPLLPYLELIDNSKTMHELIINTSKVEEELGISIVVHFAITPDLKDNNKLSLMFAGNQICQLKKVPQYKKQLEEQYNFLGDMLKYIDYDEETINEYVEEFKKYNDLVCENTLSIEELNDIEKAYEKMTLADLYNIYSNIDLKQNLSYLNLDDTTEIYVSDVNYHKNVNETLNNQYLDLYKNMIKSSLLNSFGATMSSKFREDLVKFQTKMVGFYPYVTLEEEALAFVEDIYSSSIDQEFAKKYFTDEKKEELTKLVDEIVLYYEDILRNNEWLSSKTKEKAIEKLKNLKVVIGEPLKYSDMADNIEFATYEEGGSLFENFVIYNKAKRDVYLEKFKNNDVSNDEWPMSIRTFNAYYNFQDNSINIPASVAFVLEDNNNNYFANLGTIGMIIAHEITHAFDSNGAKFDLYGNLNEWWLDSDYKNFKDMQGKIIDYYNKYKSLNDFDVNGELTLGENIADLGAMKCITKLAEKHEAKKEDYKILFGAYAHLWYYKMLPQLELQLLTDVHAPNNVRVNAVLSSNDKFYEIYNITEKDNMFVKKEDRVNCW